MNTTSNTEIQDQNKSTKELAIELVKSIRWPAVLLIAILSFRGEISYLINAKTASYEAKSIKTVSIDTHNVCVVVSGTSPKTIVNG